MLHDGAKRPELISIERAGQAPLAVPIWYDYTPDRGVWIITGLGSQKDRALEAAGRFSLVAQQEDMPYRYVSVEGPIVEELAGEYGNRAHCEPRLPSPGYLLRDLDGDGR